MKRLAALACTFALIGCRDATQITVEVSADDAVCGAALATGVSVGALESLGGRPFAATTRGCAQGRVGSVVLVPSGGDGDDVAFRVLASVDGSDCEKSFGPKCIEARRALRFIPHEGLTVRVPLRQACEGVVCGATQTCADGVCVGAAVDPNACTGAGCDEGALPSGDAGAPDATVGDAGGDAGGDARPADAGGDAGVDTGADAGFDGAVFDAGADGEPSVMRVAAGSDYTCARLLNGTVACWGNDQLGQLGPVDAGPDATQTYVPQLVPGLHDVVAIATGPGSYHTCALLADAGVACWGNNADGELAGSPGPAQPSPVAVPGLPPVLAVRPGIFGTCALAVGSVDLHCWGTWRSGATAPGAVVPGTVAPILSAGAGAQLGCEASGDAGVLCFGVTEPLGVPSSPNGAASVIPGTQGAVQVAVGVSSACAELAPDNRVVCWGTNDYGQVGVDPDGGPEGGVTPVTPIHLPRPSVELAAGSRFVCARLDDGEVACWGRSDVGQCGGAATHDKQITPALVPSVTGALSISAGGNHACAVFPDAGVSCWGSNYFGQLGNPGGDTGIPVHVPL